MTVSNPLDALTELYFRPLADLAPAVKEHLIARLQDSLHVETPPPTSEPDFWALSGTWEDERDADEIVREIRESRLDVGHRALFD